MIHNEKGQLNIWSGLTESEKNKVLHRNKNGKNRRIRIKQKCLTLNQSLIVKMRKELRPTMEIANHLHLDANTIRNFLVKVFADQDPLDLHVIDSFNDGESAKAIGRRLNINKQVICAILKRHGIDPWKAYLDRESESFKKTGVPDLKKRAVINPDRPRMIAEDLYCFWLEMGSIEEVAFETGYSAASISGKFTKHISGYKESSIVRRQQSKEMKRQRQNQTSSSEFRFESQFSDHCVNLLQGYDVNVGLCFGLLETDLVIKKNGVVVIVELKVTSKRKEIARALGQLIIQRKESKKANVDLVLCVPDDVAINDDLEQILISTGIHPCSASGLRQLIDRLLQKVLPAPVRAGVAPAR